MSKITKSTTVSISLVIALAGGVFLISSLMADVKVNSRDIEVISKEKFTLIEKLSDIDSRLSNIEGQLGVLLEYPKAK